MMCMISMVVESEDARMMVKVLTIGDFGRVWRWQANLSLDGVRAAYVISLNGAKIEPSERAGLTKPALFDSSALNNTISILNDDSKTPVQFAKLKEP